jgi:hypothetical protein
MKNKGLAISLAAAIALTGATALPVAAQTVSGRVHFATPAATIGTNDAVAIQSAHSARDDYASAKAEYTAVKHGKGSKSAFKNVEKKFKAADKAFANAKKVIGKTFRDSVAAAKTVFLAENAVATSTEMKLAAKNKFSAAKSQAASDRAAALVSLGAAPAKPKK